MTTKVETCTKPNLELNTRNSGILLLMLLCTMPMAMGIGVDTGAFEAEVPGDNRQLNARQRRAMRLAKQRHQRRIARLFSWRGLRRLWSRLTDNERQLIISRRLMAARIQRAVPMVGSVLLLALLSLLVANNLLPSGPLGAGLFLAGITGARRDGPPRIGRLHTENVIGLLGRNFPIQRRIAEIAKNSNDEYMRLIVEGLWTDVDGNDLHPVEDRMILVAFCDNNLIVLDVGGMNEETIDKWSGYGFRDEENMTGEREQGIGAKVSMRNLCDDAAYLTSFKGGMLNKVGFLVDEDSDDLKVLPEWIHDSTCSCGGNAHMPDATDNPSWVGGNRYGAVNEDGDWEWNCENKALWNVPHDDAIAVLKNQAAQYGLDLDSKWVSAARGGIDGARAALLDIIRRRQSWTMIVVKGIEQECRIPWAGPPRASAVHELYKKMQTESQIRLTLEQSYVLWVDGVHAQLLEPRVPDPMEGIEPIDIEIEGPYIDPTTDNELVVESPIRLQLNASQQALNSSALIGLRGVRINDTRCDVWTHAIPAGADPGAANYVYGRAIVPASLSHRADPGRDNEPECWEAAVINAAIDDKITEFVQAVSEVTGQRTRDTPVDDTVQNAIDDMMNQFENEIDIDALYEEGVEDGGLWSHANEISHIFVNSQLNPLAEAKMTCGVGHDLNIIAKGRVRNGLGPLEQLKGVRGDDRFAYFAVESSDDSVVSVNNHTIAAESEGTATITVSSTDLLDGSASAEFEITVVSIGDEPRVNLSPTPGPRGMTVNIGIEAESKDGETLTEKDTIFGISVEGPGSVNKGMPPSFKTNLTIGDGLVRVQWNVSDTVDVEFTTTEELHIPRNRDADGNDGQTRRKFPRLVICGTEPFTAEELEGMGLDPSVLTMNESTGNPTLVYDPDWHDHLRDQGMQAIVWLNKGSWQARAALRSPLHRRGTVGTDTDTFKRWQLEQGTEVCIRQLMQEEVLRGTSLLPQSPEQLNEIRDTALHRFNTFFERIANGEIGGI